MTTRSFRHERTRRFRPPRGRSSGDERRPEARGRSPLLFLLAATALLLPVLPAGGSGQTPTSDLSSLFPALEFRELGPYRGGRVTTVTGVPGAPHTFYFGSTGGGVWKTTTAGRRWENISDGAFEAGSIGAVAVAPSDPEVIWVGTGSGAPRGNVSSGIGVYRTTDGGETWSHVGLPDAGLIDRIRVHPSDPDVAYVAALGRIFRPNPQRGVFRTTDGGETWEKVLFISEETGVIDLAIDAHDPRVLYAATWTARRLPWDFVGGPNEGGIYKTTDGGDSWEPIMEGMPDGPIGKLAVTVSAADPERLWAIVEHEPEGGLYRSDDGGASWSRVNEARELRSRAWYYTNVYADPADRNTVYYLGEDMFRSTDGGETLEEVPVPHVDNHDLWINPDDPRIMVEGNDGGATVTLDGGRTWSTQMNQPTAEIYRLAVDDAFPWRVYGAQQDNTTISLPTRTAADGITIQHWKTAGGGESGHIAVDPRNPDVVYAGSHGGTITRLDLSSGLQREIMVYPQLHIGMGAREMRYRFQWNAPIRLSSHDPDVLYMTSQHVHRSTDRGRSWETISPDLSYDEPEKQEAAGEPVSHDATSVEFYNTIFAFEESPHRAGVLWAGTDDGRVWIRPGPDAEWTEVTPDEMPGEGSTVNMIELSPHRPGRAFLAVHRYRLGDFRPYVFRTDDGGESWSLLTDEAQGIPDDHFVRVVREDPEREGLLFAGTEFDLYVSLDDGATWRSFQGNLPATPITDLKVHRGDLVLSTQGRGFWILDDLAPLREWGAGTAGADLHLFSVRDAYRTRGGRVDEEAENPMIIDPLHGGWIPAYAAGDNPPPGAILSYVLGREPAEEQSLTLEVLTEEGDLVRRFTSDPPGREALRGSDAPGLLVEDPERELPADEGLNRFSWDLGHGPVNMVEDAFVWGYTGGPTAVPGTYRARLSLGADTVEESFRVRADPRIEISTAAFREQFELETRVQGLLARTQTALRRIRAARDEADSEARRRALTEVEEDLMQTRNEYRMDPLNFPPKLAGQLSYLYRMVHGADGTPTAGTRERWGDLEPEIREVLERAEELLGTPIARGGGAGPEGSRATASGEWP